MPRTILAVLAALVLLIAAACDRPIKPGTITPSDDATTDVSSDSVDESDVGPDGTGTPDTSADATPDSGVDATPDAQADTLKPDTIGTPEGDDDNDGVKNAKEKELGTDPNNPDSDGDGFWDGWEVNVGTNPLDKNSHPEYKLPPGKPLLLQVKKIVLPQTLGALIPANQLSRVPPIFLFIDGVTDGANDSVQLVGGIGIIVSNGPDDIAGTPDDQYGLRSTSFNQQTGDLLISIGGTIKDQMLGTAPNDIKLDLSSVSTLTKGVVLTVSKATISGKFNADFTQFTEGVLKGELSLETIAEVLEKVPVNIPLTPKQILALLDPDKNGIVEAEFEIIGRSADVVGVVITGEEKLPELREPGICCPVGLNLGAPIDSFLVVQDQGIQEDEEELAPQFVDALMTDPEVDLVVTMRVKAGEKHYYVYAMRNVQGVPTRMEIEYVRERKAGKQTFKVINQVGGNPLALFGDPQSDAVVNRMGTLQEELSLGTNPFKTVYPEEGYLTADDPRLAFVESEQMTYPFAYERLAALFDDPRAPDMIVMPRAYVESFSTHGSLDSPQSRSPLIVIGKGVKNAANFVPKNGDNFEIKTLPDGTQSLFWNKTVRQVDIAPTIAAALKLQKTTGVDETGHLSDQVYLAWQDGHPLLDLFSQDPEQQIDPPKYAVIIINDGLTNTELVHELLNQEFEVPGYRDLARRGVTLSFGSISNFPSNTYPGHNTVVSGLYSGHHGVINNHYYERELQRDLHPIVMLTNTSFLFGSAHPNLPMETLHDALHRNFGVYDSKTKTGALTVSINDPGSHGADFSTLETESPTSLALTIDESNKLKIGDTEYELPPADLSDPTRLLDNVSVRNMVQLYTDPAFPAPRFVIINFTSTDHGGHSHGPHGDIERNEVIKDTSYRVSLVIKALENACLPKGDPNCKPFFEQGILVLTSDHGMELADSARNKSPLSDKLKAAGLKFVLEDTFLYIKTLHAELSTTTFESGKEVTLLVTVIDGDGLNTPLKNPREGAKVSVTVGSTTVEGLTDADGVATLTFTPQSGNLELRVEAENYNPYTRTLVVP